MNVKEFMNELQAECGLYKRSDMFVLFNAVEPSEYLNLTVGLNRWLFNQPVFIKVELLSYNKFYVLVKSRLTPIDSYFDTRTTNLLELKNVIKNACLEIKEYRYKKKLEEIKKDFE